MKSQEKQPLLPVEADSQSEEDESKPLEERIRPGHVDRARDRRKTTKRRERLAQSTTKPGEELETKPARIVRPEGKYFIAALEDGAEIRVQTTKSTRSADPNETLVAIGDRVRVEVNPDPPSTIREVLPRKTKLARRASGRGDSYAQVIVSNIDLLVIVASILEPPLRMGIIDRYVVAGLEGGLEIAIAINKIDLLHTEDGREMLEEYQSVYRDLGYRTFGVSANLPESLGPLRTRLNGKASVFAGHSGVGKTSLVNALMGEEIGKTAVLSKKYRRGAHTTSRSMLVKLGDELDTYIVDTPGVREFANHAIDPQTLKFYFVEFAKFAEHCAITNCSHLHEPGCAVIAAVEGGSINVERYASYEKLYSEADKQERKLRERL